jgi:hypothetical protein
MKKLFLISLMSASWAHGQTNYCEVNPLLEDGLVVSGAFSSATGKHEIAYFKANTNGTSSLILNGNSGSLAWTGNYNVENFRGRVVCLDADGDGHHNEIAALYNNGNNTMSILVWQYVYNLGTWAFNVAYTSAPVYDLTKVGNRIAAGDFDNDGRYDDIAAFYDYGAPEFKIHMFRFDGNYSIAYDWYYETYGYDATKTTGRIVSGDFDRDGYIDDIAALYDYGSNSVQMHVFNSNGSSITQANYYWAATGYNPAMVNGTLVSGNFDKSGVINHKNDDIVALYDYGSGNVKAHVWTNTGSQSFSYSWKWQVSGFDVSQVRNRMFQFQPSGDSPEKNYHMGGLYNYGSTTSVMYKWTNNFNSNWDFGTSTPNLCGAKSLMQTDEETAPTIEGLSVYPNPSTGIIHYKAEKELKFEIYSVNGTRVPADSYSASQMAIDLSTQEKGVYFIHFTDENNLVSVVRFV